MKNLEHDDKVRARVTVTVEMPAAEASAERVRQAISASFDPPGASNEARIVSIDAVELVGSDDDAPAAHQPTNRHGRTFRDSASLEQLIAEQGVTPIQNIDELAGDFWPEDEGPDDFVNWLRKERGHIDDDDTRRFGTARRRHRCRVVPLSRRHQKRVVPVDPCRARPHRIVHDSC